MLCSGFYSNFYCCPLYSLNLSQTSPKTCCHGVWWACNLYLPGAKQKLQSLSFACISITEKNNLDFFLIPFSEKGKSCYLWNLHTFFFYQNWWKLRSACRSYVCGEKADICTTREGLYNHSVSLESGLKENVRVTLGKMRVGWRNMCFAGASISSRSSAVASSETLRDLCWQNVLV